MNKRAVWSLVVGGAVAVVAVVAIAVASSGDDDPSASATTTPTPAASQPVRTPDATEPTKTPSSPSPKTSSTPRPSATPKTVAPVKIDAKAPIDQGATAKVTKLESVTSVSKVPGEIAGPAVRVTLTITAGDRPVKLDDVVVNGYYGKDLTPSISVLRPGAKPFQGTVKAGEDVQGVYVFNVPKSERDDVTFELFFAASEPPIRFRGPVS